MPRVYHVEIARFAADADAKWVDNLLSHFPIPGVEGARQGLARRITTEGVYHVALIRLLSRAVGVSIAAAVTLSQQLLTPNVNPRVPIADGIEIWFDRETFLHRIDAAITEAVESIVPARRGRPPRHLAQVPPT